jgi:membrane-bound lytic murein transglycosylase B
MIKKFVIIFVLVGWVFFFPTNSKRILAAIDCVNLNPNASEADREYCKNELAQIEAQLAELLKKQAAQQKQTGTLKGDVDYLNAQINALKAKIKARSLAIAQLKISINEKTSKIGTLQEKIEKEHQSLAQLLRNTNEFDNENIIYLVLSEGTISDFYGDLESYASIKKAVKESVEEITGVKIETEQQKKDLEAKHDAEMDAKAELESAQKQVAQSEAEKQRLLAISKQKETEYKKLAAEQKAKADKIRSALFSLAGISQKIEFGTALEYAEEVQRKTGVDPAFLLAILTQESNLGANVGQCYLTNIDGPQAGYGVSVETGKVWPNLMKPTRDLQPFLDITSKLQFNPFKTQVSCPTAGVQGYGGAMGPAQFIPSTWQLFAGRLQNILGHFANPWNPKDSFMASAMYLADLGAIGNSYSAQIKAACRYYGSGGVSCTYGKSVMGLKAKIQSDIDYLKRYGTTKQ